MERKELEIIQELMDQLKDQMEFSEDDLSERLGRKKPGVEVVKIEGKLPDESELEDKEEDLGMDLDGDDEMGEEPDHMSKVMEEDLSPEELLKKRLMKLRE